MLWLLKLSVLSDAALKRDRTDDGKQMLLGLPVTLSELSLTALDQEKKLGLLLYSLSFTQILHTGLFLLALGEIQSCWCVCVFLVKSILMSHGGGHTGIRLCGEMDEGVKGVLAE